MSTQKPSVPLTRYFSLVQHSNPESDEPDWEKYIGVNNATEWDDLEKQYRCVILAEAGAGKTHEMITRAKRAQEQNKTAFFIRIENIESDFEDEFEIGDEHKFEQWLESDTEAWFYLDSVDEARLANTKAFEKAIKCFSRRIKSALQRAHVIVSSRPYAWRTASDRKLLEEQLPYTQQTIPPEPAPLAETQNQQNGAKVEDRLKVYNLKPISTNDIRLFAEHRKAENIDQLIDSLERSNLTSMAERPFDLDMILDKWQSDKELGQRLEMLQHSIKQRLKEIDTDRAASQPLHLETALQGARLIAAAIALTGEPGIKVPGSQAPDGIDASELLGTEWPDRDVRALLERGIFNGLLYNHVRFRHREIRDLLAAEWFHEQLKKGASRRRVENLFFAEQYGEKVIRPRLRSVLVWLTLFDADIRNRAVSISPEIVTEGGDPACLPFLERKQILTDIVQRIANDKTTHNVQDNSSIARVALPDLAETTLDLIEQYKDNSDVIWFLGRLVWQGQMALCLPPLKEIALNPDMNKYARYASVRAVMTTGSEQESQSLWERLNQLAAPLDPQILTEAISASSCSVQSVELLLKSIGKLPPHNQYDSGFSGLKISIHGMLDRDSVLSTSQETEPLFTLVSGLNKLLEREPHIERNNCPVSEEYKWLIPTASHAIERLTSARSPNALHRECLHTLSLIPEVRYWRGMEEDKYQEKLEQLIPEWHQLNDALFWHVVEKDRKSSDKPVTNIWDISMHRLSDRFDKNRFTDILGYINIKSLIDDKLVALSLAFKIFNDADKPYEWLEALQRATTGISELENELNQLINPVISETVRLRSVQRAEEEKEWKIADQKRRQEEEQQHKKWAENLQANPEHLEYLPNTPKRLTDNLIRLMYEVDEPKNQINHETLHSWKNLTPRFGEEVAVTYRKIAIQQWRRFTPELRSEGGDTTSWTYAFMLAFAGLEIEFKETEKFVQNLSEKNAQHLLRYWFWSLDRLQDWMEPVYQKFPRLVFESFWKELQWELENTPTDNSLHYVLGNIEYCVPWLKKELSDSLLQWLKQNQLENPKALKQCLSLTLEGNIETRDYIDLIQAKISESGSEETTAIWYVLWLFIESETALPAIEDYLVALPKSEATVQAQFIIIHIFDIPRSDGLGPLDDILKPDQLKRLYILMHQYIRKDEDINRSGGGVYSPGLRDNAQDAREALLRLISRKAGKDSHAALTQLSNEHPVISARTWMRSLAYQRAEQDSELDLMSAQQVREFADRNSITPTSHKQLFDLTVDQLLDLKDWLEQGNDSPYKVWQKSAEETEVRNLFSGQLNKMALGRYNCTQENELANAQRPDLWMTSIHVKSSVPVELKVLDKNWSGSDLCERLRNQLAGDYLREEEARCGVFLLVWLGQTKRSFWEIENKRVKLPELQSALTQYWNSIASGYAGISKLEILVIDLTIREHKANS